MSIRWGPSPLLPSPAVRPPCPRCDSQEVDVFGKSLSSAITWFVCRVCGHTWTWPN